MNQSFDTFLQALSVAIKRYAQKSGYRHANQMAAEVDINRSSWDHLAAAQNPIPTELYARIFHRFGIPEADPRLVPLEHRKRAFQPWTEDRWQRWLREEGPKYKQGAVAEIQPAPASPPAPPTEVKKPPSRLLEGPLPPTKSMAEAVLEQLADLVADRLAVRGQTFPQPEPARLETAGDIGYHADALYKALVKVKDGSVADRNRAYEEYRFELGRLLPLIEALVESKEKDREQAFSRVMEVEL